MSTCYIQFDNYQAAYYPGNTIAGRVICSFNKSQHIRAIKIKLKGHEHNEWMGTENYYDTLEKTHKTRSVRYTGDRTFLIVKNILYGEGPIGPGRFDLPFVFQLPLNIPSTYRGRYGGIYFIIEAKVDRPFKFDYKDSKEIIVVAPINFNNMATHLQLLPVSYSDEKTTCCWCCNSGVLNMLVELEKEAFVPGEVARVNVTLNNMSNEKVERVRVKIGMTIQSKVNFPSSDSKYDSETLAVSNEEGVEPHGNKTYNFELLIPQSIIIPNFSLCTLFHQRSRLKVTAVLPSCHGNMNVITGITMGHIPLGNTHELYPPPPYTPSMHPYFNSDDSMSAPPYQPPSAGYMPPSSAPPMEHDKTPALTLYQGSQDSADCPPFQSSSSAPHFEEGASAPFSEDIAELPSYKEALSYPQKE